MIEHISILPYKCYATEEHLAFNSQKGIKKRQGATTQSKFRQSATGSPGSPSIKFSTKMTPELLGNLMVEVI